MNAPSDDFRKGETMRRAAAIDMCFLSTVTRTNNAHICILDQTPKPDNTWFQTTRLVGDGAYNLHSIQLWPPVILKILLLIAFVCCLLVFLKLLVCN